jgi:hypothetical protein
MTKKGCESYVSASDSFLLIPYILSDKKFKFPIKMINSFSSLSLLIFIPGLNPPAIGWSKPSGKILAAK